MKNFDWTQFTQRIAIRAPKLIVYDAWTKASEIEKWFLSEAKYFRNGETPVSAGMPVQAGDTYTWRWYLYAPAENGRITEANGQDKLQFTFAGDCLVDVTLSTEHGYTIVELTQKNIPTDEESQRNIRLGCHTGWAFYLVNLKSVCEGGLDLRNKDERFKPMLNN